MALFSWNDSFSVNVSEIDLQHKKLVNLLNELSDAMKLGKGNDKVGNILNELTAYAVAHFKTEEKYFVMYKFPEADSHIEEHTDFVQKVTDFKKEFENGTRSLTVEVLDFLCDWLQKHIMGSDKNYSSFFNEKGLR